MSTNLHQLTIRLLQETNISVAEICRRADVHPRWLHKLRNGYYSDPGVNKVQRVHDFLATTDPDPSVEVLAG